MYLAKAIFHSYDQVRYTKPGEFVAVRTSEQPYKLTFFRVDDDPELFKAEESKDEAHGLVVAVYLGVEFE